MRKALQAIVICLGLITSSCAYVQTHKNIEQAGNYYDGEILDTNTMGLYKQGDQWYLSAKKARFRLHYPIVHDSVFRKNDYSPKLEIISSAGTDTVYHPISSSSAQVLQRHDGYFQLQALAEDITRTPGQWTNHLPHAQQYPISAEIGGPQTHRMEGNRMVSRASFVHKALGKLDLIFVDIPATLVYNVAIPIMAPFVFFYEFTNED